MEPVGFGRNDYPVIRMAQYITGLTIGQDELKEAGKALLSFFKLDLVAFGKRGGDGKIRVFHASFSRPEMTDPFQGLMDTRPDDRDGPGQSGLQISKAIAETLDSGFLTLRQIPDPSPVSLAFLPLARENRVFAVMIVGRQTDRPFARAVLNEYLAVAGLVGTTASRLALERELGNHRQRLEVLVRERTNELDRTNRRLEAEILQRGEAEQRVERLNRVLVAMNKVAQLIVREKNRDRLIQGACDLLVQTRSYSNTWIVLVNEDGNLAAAARAGVGERFEALAKRVESGQWTECMKRAENRTETVVIKDPYGDCPDCPLAGGYRGGRGLIVRLKQDSRLHGFLYASISGCLITDSREKALFKVLGQDIAAAINAIELETKRRHAQAERDHSLSQLQATLEATADGILVVGLDNKIKLYNKRFKKMWQIPDEILGSRDNRRALDFVSGQLEDPAAFLSNVRQLYDNPEAKSFGTFRFADGRVFERYSRPQVLDNVIIGRVWSFRDVTQRQKTEKQKQELQARLRQVQKMEAIGILAGGIAHEFNNLLGIIMGNAELAIDDLPDFHKSRGFLEEIREACLRAKDVVRQVLTSARKNPAARTPVNIRAIIKDSLKLIRATIPAFIEIRQEISGDSDMILGDATEIGQILLNLCANAVQAMENEPGILRVMLAPVTLDEKTAGAYDQLGPGRYVKLTVSDTGRGIDPSIMDRIFDPFFTTKAVGEGSGMGLAVVNGIVKKHEGAVRLFSQKGEGTTAEVLFPVTFGRPEPELQVARPSEKGREHILLVDDEPSLVEMIRLMLTRLGYRVTGTHSPKEAMGIFRDAPARFDLIITDMAMPEIPGDKLAAEFLKIRRDIPIILCTGHSGRLKEDTARQMGIKAIAMKPFTKDELGAIIRKALEARMPAG